jgi:hypothetical protein
VSMNESYERLFARTVIFSFAPALACACGITLSVEPALAEKWYPSSAAPYPGTAFHCDLRPLPSDMPGIKDEDKEFIDHACAVLLKCAQEKEGMLLALRNNTQTKQLPVYVAAVSSQIARLKGVTAPKGLETFQSDVESAINLQVEFFKLATIKRSEGTAYDAIMAIPEGKQASQKLFGAWDEMQKRYWLFWNGPSKDSIYHHLCALDLY